MSDGPPANAGLAAVFARDQRVADDLAGLGLGPRAAAARDSIAALQRAQRQHPTAAP